MSFIDRRRGKVYTKFDYVKCTGDGGKTCEG